MTDNYSPLVPCMCDLKGLPTTILAEVKWCKGTPNAIYSYEVGVKYYAPFLY